MNATTDPAGMFGVALLAVSTAILLSAWRCALVAIGNSVLVTITMAVARHSSLVFILHPRQQMGAGEPDAAMLDVAARSTSTASIWPLHCQACQTSACEIGTSVPSFAADHLAGGLTFLVGSVIVATFHEARLVELEGYATHI